MNDNLQISGKWINKLTGDVINVRDNIIDGDNMIIISDKGQMSMNEFSSNYIQMSEGDIATNQKISSDVPSMSGLLEEDKVIFDNINKSSTQQIDNIKSIYNEPDYGIKPNNKTLDELNKSISKKQNTVSENKSDIELIIEKNNVDKSSLGNTALSTELLAKLFEKLDFKINLKISVLCDEFPVNELKMLMNVYDITLDDITDVFYKFYSGNDTNIMKDILNKIIENKLK